MSELRHKPGLFCWAELMTTDPEAARGFYSGLMGWTMRNDQMAGGGVYTTFCYEGLEAAACYQLSPQMLAAGVPPHWMPYLMVEDIGASAEKVTACGGKVHLGPRQAGNYGSMAIVSDPGGATFALWQANTHFGSRNGHVLGRHCWTELATRDAAASKDFYTKVFGWGVHVGEMGGMEYTTFHCEGAPAGGMYTMPTNMDGVPPHWMVYFSLADVHAAVAATRAAGGTPLCDPMEIPGVGTCVSFRDAQGAHVSVIQLKQQ